MSQRPFSLCVYCGSRPGRDEAHAMAAQAVGREIGRRGWRLVYGGGHVGLMGTVADATLAAGGQALGVIPRKLMEREVGHRGLTELVVVESMHERKRIMAEHADAFLALPGGIGTMEELFEVWTWRQIGYHDQPVGLLNVAGYYDPLLAFLDRMTAEGFLSPPQQQVLCTDDDAVRLLDTLEGQARKAGGRDDYSQI